MCMEERNEMKPSPAITAAAEMVSIMQALRSMGIDPHGFEWGEKYNVGHIYCRSSFKAYEEALPYFSRRSDFSRAGTTGWGHSSIVLNRFSIRFRHD